MIVPIVACIPTIGLSPYLEDLVQQLLEADATVMLYVNSESVPENILRITEGWPFDVGLIHQPGDSIYVEWNAAAKFAYEQACHLLAVTDDVVLQSDVVEQLAGALNRNPDFGLISTDVGSQRILLESDTVTQISHQLNNRYLFATWCFIARAGAWQDVDSRYKIWYGDDDLIWKVNASGMKTGYLKGVGVVHHTSTTSNQLLWVHQAAAEDGQLWSATGH